MPFNGNDMLREQMTEILQNQFGLGIRPIWPRYRKSYPDWVDVAYPWPRNYRIPDFTLFTGSGEVSTMEHMGRLTLQCGEVNEFHRLRLFHGSLSGVAFSWYVSLPANSVESWQQME